MRWFKKSKFPSCVGVFGRNGKLFVQPYSRTTAGVYMGVAPVLMAPLDVSSEELGQMVLRSFHETKEGVPHPADWTNVPTPLWDAAGVRSWRAFVKGALDCEVCREGSVLKIQPMKNMGAKGGFVQVEELEKRIPAESTPALVGDLIRQALEFAAANMA